MLRNANMLMNSVFIKKITYEVDEYRLFQELENLSYEEYRIFRNDFLQFSENHQLVSNTYDAKGKYWSRLIKILQEKYSFTVPVSTTKHATEKRNQRMR